MAELQAKGVWKIYGKKGKKVEAVKNLNLNIKDGEFVSLLGPSGCGKSSTLRMIAGLEEISRGEMFIGDKKINNLEPGERDVAMVFENYALLPHLTAFENIALPLRLQKNGESESAINKKVKEISNLLDMDSFLNKPAGMLGGGQKQRVGIARALIKKSSVLLMDEPISHLDADLRARTRGELARLQKLLGITTVYVTHDQLEALAMADRIAVMNHGELQQYGTPEELYDFPANKFVAGFIGEPSMNFIPFTLKRNGNLVILTMEEGTQLTLKDGCAEAINPEFKYGKVWLGVRPRDIRITSCDEENTLKGEVIHFSLGCEKSLVEVRLGSNKILVQCSPDLFFKDGDSIYIDIISQKYHLFDIETEASLINMDTALRGGRF